MSKLVSLKSTIRAVFAIAAILLIIPACRQERGTASNVSTGLVSAALDARIDPGEATIGDRITYTLSLSRTPKIVAELPELGASPEGLTPVDSGHSGPRSEGGRVVEKRWAAYRADRVGTLVFPPVKMRYQQDGADRETEAQAVTLQVKSVLPRNMTDIHGLKPLEPPKRNLLLFFSVASLLVLSAVAAWFLWKKRKNPETVIAVLSPHVEFDRRLRELEAMGLIAKGDFKKYYFLLSESFRKYLERRFEFPAVERTTEEIFASLDALKVTEAQRDEVRTFLRAIEPVKFAGAGCSPEEAVAETDRVRRFVAKTRRQIPERTEESSHVAV